MEKDLKLHAHHNLLTELIKSEARLFGFDAIGITRPRKLTKQATRLEKWLSEGNNNGLHYLSKNFKKMTDPFEIMSDCRSVIVVIMNYYPSDMQDPKSDYKIAKYAYGKDYHDIVKERVTLLANFIETTTGTAETKVFVDSGTVLEKVWAVKAGLGWQGKNSVVINPDIGSFFFIGVIFTDFTLEYDTQIDDQCGKCRLCIDACPAKAIFKPYAIDARRCISCQTIEFKYMEDKEFSKENYNWIFGCDICQDVCPYNKLAAATTVHGFETNHLIRRNKTKSWEKMTEDAFENHFNESSLYRIKYSGLKRNIAAVKENIERKKWMEVNY
jgi:epoxyqueuosine reductase